MNEVCVGDGAPVDAHEGESVPIEDEDGDGVADASDNCATVANPTQANEDGDKFGDACDGCPPLSDDSPVDDDGDGVENDCDPNPNTPGDTIAFFEGFDDGLPTGWMPVGQWLPASGGGAVVAAPADGELAWFRVAGVAPDASSTSSASITPLDPLGGPGAFGIAAPINADGDGLTCLFFYPLADDTDERVGIVRRPSLAIVTSAAFVWSPGTAYTFVEQQRNGKLRCEVSGVPNAFDVDGDALPSPAYFGVFTRSITARVDWVMHVDSP